MTTSSFANNQQSKSKAGFVFGGLAFIPLIGILLGTIAIIIGLLKKQKGPVLLGLGGILFSVILYGSLFYFGFVAKTGPYADIKIKLTQQLLNDDKSKILAFKLKTGKLPDNLNEIPSDYQIYPTDAWSQPLIYEIIDGQNFKIQSIGPDGVANTSDDILPTI